MELGPDDEPADGRLERVTACEAAQRSIATPPIRIAPAIRVASLPLEFRHLQTPTEEAR